MVSRLRWLLKFPYRMIWVLPLAFVAGYFAPWWTIFPAVVIGLPWLVYEYGRVSDERGYLRSQMEMAEIMLRAGMPGEDGQPKSDSRVLEEIAAGLYFQTVVAPSLKRSTWQRVTNRG